MVLPVPIPPTEFGEETEGILAHVGDYRKGSETVVCCV